VESNDVFSILGPNGCGKTTLLYALAGIYQLKEGQILLDGKDIASLPRQQIAKTIGFIPQDDAVSFPYSVFSVVLMGRAPHLSVFSSPSKKDGEIASAAIDSVGISEIRNRPCTNISGGERRLVSTARALAQEPQIIIADEPTSHLDIRNQVLLLKTLKCLAERRRLIIIMTSHYPDHALLFSNRAAIMHNASFAEVGGTEEVITEENLRVAYGLDIKVVSLNDPNNRSLKVCIPVVDSVDIPHLENLKASSTLCIHNR
jgi:iron complex transport system ATP-binding protein